MQIPNNTPQLDSLTTKQAAKLIGIQPATLEHWRWAKTGPRYLKLGRAVRYRREDLQDWMNSRAVECSPNDAA